MSVDRLSPWKITRAGKGRHDEVRPQAAPQARTRGHLHPGSLAPFDQWPGPAFTPAELRCTAKLQRYKLRETTGVCMAEQGASVVVQRRVEWPDTDAAGHYHHSTVVRWVEAAESVLHERLGLTELFGVVPRVRYEADYLEQLWFRDVVDVELRVAAVGRTSVRYEFEVRRAGRVAARGAMVAVNSDPAQGGAQPWPEDVRKKLLESGPQRPELIG